MKLFYKSGACSLSPHIVLFESGLPFTIEAVDLATKKTATGDDFKAINPKGQVPTLVLDNGEILTEGSVIVQYIADKATHSGLIATPGTISRYRQQEWLNFISTELHKGFSPLFNAKMPEEAKTIARERLISQFDYVSGHINDGAYLTGSAFCVADAYLFTVLNWAQHVGIDLAKWPNLVAYQARVTARPSVQNALLAEGLIKAAA